MQRQILRFLTRGWPYLLFGALIATYTWFFFCRPESRLLGYLQFLVNAFVALAVVVYVVYTRDIAVSGQQTADANRQLIETMRSLLVEEWVAQERPRADVKLVRGGQELSRALHVEDVGMPGEMYDTQRGGLTPRILIFRPFNCGPRVILLRRLKLEITHARGVAREISCDPERPLRIPQNDSIEMHIIYNFTGEIDARILEVEYLDGDRAQITWIASPWRERRYFAPENAGNPG